MNYVRLIIFLFLSIQLQAQKHANNWVLGNNNILSFNTNSLLIGANNLDVAVSSFSNPKTGELMFYTSHTNVYNKLHQQMPNGDKISGEDSTFTTITIPNTSDTNKYYLISYGAISKTITYCIIDFSKNALGEVTDKAIIIRNNADRGFGVAGIPYGEGYWLITHTASSRQFVTYRIGREGISKDGLVSYSVLSTIGYPNTAMAINPYAYAFAYLAFNDKDAKLGLLQFNRECGTIDGYFENLAVPFDTINLPKASFCFSPNNRYVYAMWSNALNSSSPTRRTNILIQYRVQSSTTIATTISTDSISMNSSIQVGPDGKVYRYVYDNDSFFFLAVQKPNEFGINCSYDGVNRLFFSKRAAGVSNISTALPLFFSHENIRFAGFYRPKMLIETNCLNYTVDFAMGSVIYADSILWEFGDGDASGQRSPQHLYKDTGTYLIKLNWYMCGFHYYITDTLKLKGNPVFDLGKDTTLCYQANFLLSPTLDGMRYLWNTGDTTQQILIDSPGKYTLTIFDKDCFTTDEINIDYHPSIMTALGDEYTICDKDRELVKLDAGEGFSTYKWTPTDDTTQWIIVGEVKDYFVVVKDFRGCDGSDGTTVKRHCSVVAVYFPNSFTPNNDGNNDTYAPVGVEVVTFNLKIYNRWGQLVFESNNISHTWDGTLNGKFAPADSYIYQAEYSGYVNKKLLTFDKKGNITLIR